MSVLGDISSLSTTVQSYWKAVAAFINGIGSAPSPNYLTPVTYGDLAAFIEHTFDANVGLTQGALKERADAYNAHSRDITLRQMTKTQYYQQGLQEFTDMSTIETAEATKAAAFATGQSQVQHYTVT